MCARALHERLRLTLFGEKWFHLTQRQLGRVRLAYSQKRGFGLVTAEVETDKSRNEAVRAIARLLPWLT